MAVIVRNLTNVLLYQNHLFLHFILVTWGLIFSLFIAPVTYCVAQPFQKTIGANDLDKARVMKSIPGDGFIIGGETARPASNETDDLLLQVDQKGTVQWSKSYGGIERETVNDLTIAPDSGFLLAAEKYKQNASDGEFLQLIKTDQYGNMQWKKTYDEGGSELEGYSVITLSRGGYLFSGLVKNLSIASSIFYTMKEETQSLYLLKTDEKGNKQWSGTLTLGTDENFAATGLSSLELQDGNYLTAGYLIRQGKNESVPQKPVEDYGNNRIRKILLLKNGPDGSLQWAKTFPGFQNAAAYSMIQTSEGDLMIAGVTLDRSETSTEIAVLRTDRKGNVKWANTYHLEGYQSVASIRETQKGNFAIAGLTRHNEANKDDGYLLQIGKQGKILWAKGIGASNNELLTSLAVKGKWHYYTGATLSEPAQSLDVFLGRTDARGAINCRSEDLPVETHGVNVNGRLVQDVSFEKLVFDESSDALRPKSSRNVEQKNKSVKEQNICDQ